MTRAWAHRLAIRKLRSSSYFAEWLLESRRRTEKAFIAVIADQTSGSDSLTRSTKTEPRVAGAVLAFTMPPL